MVSHKEAQKSKERHFRGGGANKGEAAQKMGISRSESRWRN